MIKKCCSAYIKVSFNFRKYFSKYWKLIQLINIAARVAKSDTVKGNKEPLSCFDNTGNRDGANRI